jgi:hypothetical protein
MPTPKGGRRPGAGRPRGTRNPSTITKEAAREALRQIVLREIDSLAAAQIAQAKGIKYLVVRQKSTGKFVRVTEAMAKHKQALEDDQEIIEVWEKDPSTPAFTDLMNRAIDKPKEQEIELKVTGELELVPTRLSAARKRLADRRGD